MITVSTNQNAINLQILWENERLHQKYFHLNSFAVYNSSAKNEEELFSQKLITMFKAYILFLYLLATLILYYLIVKQVKRAADSTKNLLPQYNLRNGYQKRMHAITRCLGLSLCYIPGSVTFFCSTLSYKYSLVLIYITTLIISPPQQLKFLNHLKPKSYQMNKLLILLNVD